MAGFDDQNFHIWVEEEHSNPTVEAASKTGYVLKIINTNDTVGGKTQLGKLTRNLTDLSWIQEFQPVEFFPVQVMKKILSTKILENNKIFFRTIRNRKWLVLANCEHPILNV